MNLSLDEFIEDRVHALYKFRAHWRDGQATRGKAQFPEEMPSEGYWLGYFIWFHSAKTPQEFIEQVQQEMGAEQSSIATEEQSDDEYR